MGIGRITTDGQVSLYSLGNRSVPQAIVAAPDGNLWFTESRGPGIGRITPGGAVTEFAIPGLSGSPGVQVGTLAPGPDGAVWFTLGEAPGAPNPAAPIKKGQLGRIAPDGTVKLYTPPGEGTTGPIVLGADGSLWAFGATTVTRVTLG